MAVAGKAADLLCGVNTSGLQAACMPPDFQHLGMHASPIAWVLCANASLTGTCLACQGAHDIMRQEGIAGLYHGLLPTMMRDVPEIAIQFLLYERLRQACTPAPPCMHAASDSRPACRSTQQDWCTLLAPASC